MAARLYVLASVFYQFFEICLVLIKIYILGIIIVGYWRPCTLILFRVLVIDVTSRKYDNGHRCIFELLLC